MKQTMKGLALGKSRELELIDFPVPEPKKGFVRVKVMCAGICASDIAYWRHGSPRLQLPVILGHEGSGIIDKVGEDVSKVKIGDRVILMTTYKVCGDCKYCKEGNTNLCINRQGLGSRENGFFAEYVEIPEDSCIPMPGNMSFEEGALVEVLACGVHGIKDKIRIGLNDKVVVMGPGPIGMSAALLAKSSGAHVTLAGLSQDSSRFDIARKLGITDCVNQQKVDLKEHMNKLNDGYGADIVIECSGSYHSFNTSLEIIRKKGKLLQMGIFHGEAAVKDLTPIIMKEIDLVGSASHIYDSWIVARDLISSEKIPMIELVSQVLEVKDFKKAFELAESVSGLKILLNPQMK